MTLLRNLAFMLVFYCGSVPFVLLSPVAALFGQRAMLGYARGWIGFHGWATRVLLGIHCRVEGDPHLATPALYAAKHQSMYETIELSRLLDRPAIVMKQELAAIPVWGWAARRYGVIVVDREASAGALRRMLREAKVALEAERSILIFPEGTRVHVGDQPPLKSGFAGLYQMLKLPVVPVALDSGEVWPRKGLKRSGVVTIRFGEVVPPGLPRKQAEAVVHAAINALEDTA
jgi:1-acyl-sn-glycerol-3-phosphate acyltransferase